MHDHQGAPPPSQGAVDPPSPAHQTVAQKAVNRWLRGLSPGEKNCLGGHALTALREEIAYVLVRQGVTTPVLPQDTNG